MSYYGNGTGYYDYEPELKAEIYDQDDAEKKQKGGALKNLGAPVIVGGAESTDVGGTKTESTDAGYTVNGELINGYGAKTGTGGGSSEKSSYTPYSIFSDPLFQMYQSMYMGNAQKAMKGAIAESALLTGGYGNSFGQVAGQQAYADVMDDFYALIPSLLSEAYSIYDSERAAAEEAQEKEQAKAAEATEKAQSEYDAAVDSEQDRAYDYALEKIESGEWNWERAEEELRSLTYIDHNGKEVSLFTEEDAAEYEDKYNASAAAAEAAENAFKMELIEMLTEHPEYATEEYLTAYFKDKGYVPDTETIKRYVETYGAPINDLKKPDEDILKEAKRLAVTPDEDDLDEYLEMLKIQGIDVTAIKKFLREYTFYEREFDNRYGEKHIDENGVITWKDGEPKTYDNIWYSTDDNRQFFYTADQFLSELMNDYGLTESEAMAWMKLYLPGYAEGGVK